MLLIDACATRIRAAGVARQWLVMMAACSTALAAATLELEDRDHAAETLANTTVTLLGRSELRLTGAGDPLPGSTVHLNSPDGWVVFTALRPSQVASTLLGRIFVDGAPASMSTNTRVVAFGNGAVVIPHGPDFEPLRIFSGMRFSGEAVSLPLYTYHTPENLAALPAGVASFRLRRGYMATFAENANGTGHSQVFIAQDDDLDVAVMPAALARNTRFIRVFPWRWTAKKGYAGGSLAEAENLDGKWRYNWNNNSESTLDIEYVPIRQTRWWPSYETTNAKQNVTHLLGFNEPDRPDQANMTVAQAIAEWPNLMRSGLRLGSPASSDGGLSWLYQFIDEADARNFRVDYVVVHFYRGGQTLAQFQNYMTQIHQRTGRPLWLKEFNNGANWTCCLPTYQQNAQVIGQWIQWMDETPWIERYSIYRWVEAQRDMFYSDGSHTPAGLVYQAQQSPVAFRDRPPLRSATTYADPRLQPNDINQEMPYNDHPEWTTGIGRTLGAELVLSRAQFEARLAAALATGHGGVIDFERGKLAGGFESGARGFTALFDGGRRAINFTSPDGHGGSHALTGPRNDRTAISGERFLSRSGNPHFDFEIEPGPGMDAGERVTSVALTALGRNGVSGTQNFRFTAWFTDGSETGSTSARRAINTSSGNGTADTFAAITAPDGWWITRVSLRSENGGFTSIDDLAIITSQISDILEWQPDGFPGGSGVWDAAHTPSWSGGPWIPGRDAHFPAAAGEVTVSGPVGGISGMSMAAGGYQFSGSGSLSFDDGAEIRLAGGHVTFGVPFAGAPRIDADSDGPVRQLRLTADNAGFAGTLHAGPGIQLRAYQTADGSGTGHELGGEDATIHLAEGAQIRWFNPAGNLAYPPAMHIAGDGSGNPGVINVDSNSQRTITLGGPVALTDNARIATQNSGSLRIDGNIDGSHVLTVSPAPNTSIRLAGSVATAAIEKSGMGTLALAGPNTFGSGNFTHGSGTTNRGFLRLGHSQALGGHDRITLAGSQTGVSGIELEGGITISQQLFTAGRQQATGAGAALRNLNGENTWAGDITITAGGGNYGILSDAGHLHLTGVISSAIESNQFGARLLQFAGAGDITISGTLARAGDFTMQDLTVTKSGTGTLTIAGNAGFTGPTTAQDGTLRVDGALAASHVTVEESATLAGTGSLPSATVRGTLALETDASLAITGTLALDDATLAIHGSPGASEPVILATHGGLTGEFAEITGVPDGWSLDTAHAGGTAIALVPDAPAGFAAWSATHLGGQGPDEDFHNDGIANLLRYALAIDPTRPSGFPGSFANGTLTFEKRPEAMAAGDVTYTILASPDLSPGSWFPIAADINNDHVISITPPVDGPGLFLRLAVQWSE